MRKKLLYLMCVLALTACENAPFKKVVSQSTASLASEASILDDTTISRIQRKKQQAVIESLFSRKTSPERAQQLAAICFEKTEGTAFTPFDLAEIALVETGGHRLSAGAVSRRGARGVWQLMPVRAKSHGFTAKDMLNDGKCAEAAVQELYTKLDMARGNLELAKKYYCGQGPQADAYMKKIHQVRRGMMSELALHNDKIALVFSANGTR